jgi:hypothetical protein
MLFGASGNTPTVLLILKSEEISTFFHAFAIDSPPRKK